MAKIITLTDDFNDNSRNTALWNETESGTTVVTEQNKRLEIALPASATAADDGYYSSADTFDLTDSLIFMKVIQTSPSSTNANNLLRLELDADNYFRWVLEAGTLYAQKRQGGVTTTVTSFTFNNTTHAWWRIRQSGSTVYFDTSENGTAWTNRGSVTYTFAITAMRVYLEAYCYQVETNPGTFIVDNLNVEPESAPRQTKRYVYHVYNSADSFITAWDDVINDYQLTQEINSAGSQVRVLLGRKPEDIVNQTDIALNNHVTIQLIDDDSDALQGKTVFKGYIADFNVIYDGQNSAVEVILFGFGADLDSYLIDMGDSIIQDNATASLYYAAKNFNNYVVAQSFTLAEKTRIASITIRVQSSDNSAVTVSLVSGLPTTYSAGTILAEKSERVDSEFYPEKVFEFNSPVDLDAGTYHFRVEVLKHGSSLSNQILYVEDMDLYSGGAFYQTADDVTDPTQTFSTSSSVKDLWFKINAGTTQPFNSQDPSDILRKILDYYIQAGGEISYDGNSIDNTGVTVTYEFNANTTLEGVKKCLELAPEGWYFYVDQATNLLHFHEKSSAPEHSLILGKNITKLNIEYRTENIINRVYFTGGEGLFKKFSRQNSIDLYGIKSFRYTDQRVTRNDTATTIANALLDSSQSPEIKLAVQVIDNSGAQRGLDLESISVGDIVKFRGFGTTEGSLWDVSFWDQAFWDYNSKQIDTLVLQITKIEYSPDKCTINLSTIPPDVNKRIEDINRRLIASDTANNPSVTT